MYSSLWECRPRCSGGTDSDEGIRISGIIENSFIVFHPAHDRSVDHVAHGAVSILADAAADGGLSVTDGIPTEADARIPVRPLLTSNRSWFGFFSNL